MSLTPEEIRRRVAAALDQVEAEDAEAESDGHCPDCHHYHRGPKCDYICDCGCFYPRSGWVGKMSQ